MQYTDYYQSPLGQILLAADEDGLTGLWLEGQKYFPNQTETEQGMEETAVLKKTKSWLDVYFSGREPEFSVPVHMKGTDFQQSVWRILCEIPYGKTITYGEIARQLAAEQGKRSMSAQAVGGAVGRNSISIIVPCHRVVGANGNLTGYAGGLDRKIKLLELEHIDMSRFFVPKRETAL